MKTGAPRGLLRTLGLVTAATVAWSGLTVASTSKYTQRGDTANVIWTSNDSCVYRAVYIYAGKNVNISPTRSVANYVNIGITVQNICTGDIDWGNQTDGTGAVLALHGAKSATLNGIVGMSLHHSNFYTGSYSDYFSNATVDISFTATDTPTRTTSETRTIAAGVVVINRVSGTLANATATGSVLLDNSTQLANGDSATASIGQSDNATLSIVRP